jgi:uncharacterized delta-60 repeat protein
VGQDNSIFLAGDVGTRNFALLKYLPDGEGLDYTFNSTGIAQGPFSEAAAVAVEPSGRIIVAGVVASSTDQWAIASFQADGALDTNFGAGSPLPPGEGKGEGVLYTGVAGDAAAMALQPDGQIVVVGDSIDPTSQDQLATIARYNSGLAVQVNEVEPTSLSATISSASYSTGDGTTLTISYADPNSQASRTVTIDWGDGTAGWPDTLTEPLAPGVPWNVPAQQYAASGQYIITVSIADAGGGPADMQIPVTYTDLAPTQLALTMPAQVVLNDNAELTGIFVDNDASQEHTVTIDWGDDSPDTPLSLNAGDLTFSTAHPYSGDGSYVVTVTVANSLGSTQQTATVDVLDSAATTDLVMDGFTVDTGGNLSVAYNITGAAATPFTIGVYSSVDGVQLGDMVQSVDVSDPALLTVGAHTVTFAVQSGALSGGRYYVADLDAYDEVAETSKTDNESVPLAGVFKGSDGSLYIFTPTTGAAETVSVANGAVAGTLNVTVNSVQQTFSGVSYIYATTYRAADSVSVDSQVQVSFTDFNAPSGDTEVGFYLSAAESGPTELDIQAAIDAVHGGTDGASLQLSAVEGGDRMEVWDAPQDGNQLTIVDGLIQTWDFSSTGQVDQSVWITQAPGASDGQVLCQVAVGGGQGNAAGAKANAKVNKPPFRIGGVKLHFETRLIRYLNGGPTLTPTNTNNKLLINPADIDNDAGLGAQYQFFMLTKCQYLEQSVENSRGRFTVTYQTAGVGGSGGTGGSDQPTGSTTQTATWEETYAVSWAKNSPNKQRRFFDLGEHQAGPAAIAEYMGRSDVYGLTFSPGDDGKTLYVVTKDGVKHKVLKWAFHLDATYDLEEMTLPPVNPNQWAQLAADWSKTHNGQKYDVEAIRWTDLHQWRPTGSTPISKPPLRGYLLPGNAQDSVWGPVGNAGIARWVAVPPAVSCTDTWDYTWNAGDPHPGATYTTSQYP